MTHRPIYTLEVEMAVGSMTNVSSDVSRLNFTRSLSDVARDISVDNMGVEILDLNGGYKRGSGLLPGRQISFYGREDFNYLNATSLDNNKASCPANSISFTNFCEVIVQFATHSGVNFPGGQAALVNQWESVNFNEQWKTAILLTGALSHLYTNDGTTNAGFNQPVGASTTSLSVGLINSREKFFLRSRLVLDDGAGRKYASWDVATNWNTKTRHGDWTNVGSAGSAGVDSIFVVSSPFCLISAASSGLSDHGALKFYYAEVSNTLSGTPQLLFDPNHDEFGNDITVLGQKSFVNSTQAGLRTWTLSNSYDLATDSTTHAMFYGRIWRVNAVAAQPWMKQTVNIDAVSDMERLSNVFLTTSLHIDIKTSSLFTAVMSECNVRSFSISSDVDDTLNYAYFKGVSARHVIETIVDTGNYKFFVDGAGTAQLKGRYFGAVGSGNLVSSLDEFYSLNYVLDPAELINQTKIYSVPVAAAAEVATVGYTAGFITIPASKSVGFWMDFIDPILGGQATAVASLTTQVASQDYYAASNADGTGTDQTSALSISFARFASTAVCTISNITADPVYLTRFQFRGYPLRPGSKIGITAEVASSQSLYGTRGLEIANALIQDYDYLDGLSQLILGDFSDPKGVVDQIIVNEFDKIFTIDVGNEVIVVNSATGVNSKWLVKEVQHDISFQDGLRHEMKIIAEDRGSRDWFVLDQSQLDNNKILGI